MKLVLGLGGGVGYYPYTQKPVDYQPYRPIYLYRGPPPDAGFSYGLYEDEEEQRQYYAELGLDAFSPFSGKPAKLLKEVNFDDLTQAKIAESEFDDVKCEHCGGEYKQNFGKHIKGRSMFHCHRCGAKIKDVGDGEGNTI